MGFKAEKIERPVLVAPARYVRIGPCSEASTGIPVGAQEKKIERGEWVRGREWRKGPDGRRYLDIRAFEAWVESGEMPPGEPSGI